MAEVNVTSDALQQARMALERFATDIEGIASRASAYSQESERECSRAIASTSGEIDALTARINNLRSQIEKAKDAISQANTKIAELERDNQRQRESLDYLSGRLMALRQELARLRQQLSQADDDEKEQIQQQIYQVENQIAQCEVSREQAEVQINANDQEIRAKKSERSEAESNRMQCEAEEAEARRIRSKYEDKLERLRADAAKLKSDMDTYAQLSRTYERSAIDDSEAYKGSLDACIALVEEYESANL